MITIRIANYDAKDIHFLIRVFETGLEGSCYLKRKQGFNEKGVCETCHFHKSCMDIQSTLFHLKSISYRLAEEQKVSESESESEVLPDS